MTRIMREIVFIRKQGELTRQGHYKIYWIILECGHVILTHYSAKTHVDEFCLLQKLKPKRRCRYCEQSKPVDVEILSHVTPYKIWKALNFDRFIEEKRACCF